MTADLRHDSTESPGAATPSNAVLQAGRLTLRLDELARALGVSRRTIERERSAGRFPRPDLNISRMPLWLVSTVRRWAEEGGAHDFIDHPINGAGEPGWRWTESVRR